MNDDLMRTLLTIVCCTGFSIALLFIILGGAILKLTRRPKNKDSDSSPIDKVTSSESLENSACREDLRTEYSALSNYFNTLVAFRLTLLGLYLAAVGFLLPKEWPIPLAISLVGLILSISLYLFELRTRVLFNSLAQRAINIEHKKWKIERDEGLFGRLFPTEYEPNYGIEVKIFGKITLPTWITVSHTVALDTLYVGLIAFFILSVSVSALWTGYTFVQSVTSPYITVTPTPTNIP